MPFGHEDIQNIGIKHHLFISSKPLDVEFQDKDKMVTFLRVANFERYIEGKLEAEDDSVLRPMHGI